VRDVSVPPFLALPGEAQQVWLPTRRGPLAAIDVPGAGVESGCAVLVPGFTGSKEDFVAVLAPLTQRGWRVIAFDQRGQSDSPGPDDVAGYTLDLLADDLVDVLAGVQPTTGRPVHLLGHSLGGLVARRAVLRLADAPASVATLTLLCSGPGALPADRQGPVPALRQALPDTPLELVWQAKEALDRAQGIDPPPPAMHAFLHQRWLAMNPYGVRGMAEILLGADDEVAALAATGVPVLVCHGADDDVWPLADQSDMAYRLGAPPVSIPGCAHSPAAEAPAPTAVLLDAFWRSGDPRQGLVGPAGQESAAAGVTPAPDGYAETMKVAVTLSPGPASVGTARRLVDTTLTEWGVGDLAEDAALVASELVTNALRHGLPPVSLAVSLEAATLRVAVHDGRPEALPLPRDLRDDETNGRGLVIVGRLAQRWGWDRDESGKSVWADLGCAAV
jgi:pimeloyl-ACP methyl ester carboxylesterase/anti-sigma regulatory factor (Ser/Thr protein kinase)